MDMTTIIDWWFRRGNSDEEGYQSWLDTTTRRKKTIDHEGLVVGFFCIEDTEPFA